MHFKDDVVNGVPNWFPTRKQFNSEFVNAEYLANIIDFLSESDVSIDPIGRNFLEGSSKITFRDRYVFINWLVLTHSQFSMCSDTLYLAISLSDRFIKANKETLIATDLIIIGIVCLFMAAKIEEIWIPTINDLLSLWNLEYTKEFCSELEIQILCAVNFQLSLPVPISFIRHYSILFSSNNLSQFLSRYFCELSLQDSEACCQSCSLIGASCVFLSEVISRNITSDFSVVWTPKLQASSGLVYADFQNLVKNLCIIVQKQATSSNLRAITQKYSCVGYMNAPNEALNSKAFRSIFLHFRNQIQANQ
uniref:CyclinB-like protein n=1 Tax=Schmidtea mediterranea TaxID=79327 RepID=D2DJT5_SCHMD|nr:cyclinB-like protein [Schmidtea mediterranea]